MAPNAVSVPTYMVRSTVNVLRRLSGVAHRNDLGGTVAEAGRLVRSFKNLVSTQTFPEREVVIAQAPLPKVPNRTWRKALRQDQFKKLFEERVLPVFLQQDEAARGQCRFTLVLTHVEG